MPWRSGSFDKCSFCGRGLYTDIAKKAGLCKTHRPVEEAAAPRNKHKGRCRAKVRGRQCKHLCQYGDLCTSHYQKYITNGRIKRVKEDAAQN